jgi:CRP-like cAMP-binding protein
MTDTRFDVGTRLPSGWNRDVQTRKYRKGETIIRAGDEVSDWVAIHRGATYVETLVSAHVKVPVATLWAGDVLGYGSPLGRGTSSYEVTALAEVETIAVPIYPPSHLETSEALNLYAATAARLNRQIATRLAGNGPQRLISVLATLGDAFAQGNARVHQAYAIGIPVAQARLGQLAGLSRRQVWIHLGELANGGWIQTTRTRVILLGLPSWLQLRNEIELRGLACVTTIEDAIETMSGLVAG